MRAWSMVGSVVAISIAIAPNVVSAEPSVSDEDDDRPAVRWPEPLSLHASAAVGTVGWGNVTFRDNESPLQMPGNQLSLSHVELVGVQAGLSIAANVFRFDAGVGYGVPRNSSSIRLPTLGPNARLSQLHVTRWYLQLGVGQRFRDVSPFLMLHGAVIRAIADVSEPTISLNGRRLSLGPRAGMRAHVYKKLFIQAAVFMDLLSLPDYSLTLGIGVGDH